MKKILSLFHNLNRALITVDVLWQLGHYPIKHAFVKKVYFFIQLSIFKIGRDSVFTSFDFSSQKALTSDRSFGSNANYFPFKVREKAGSLLHHSRFVIAKKSDAFISRHKYATTIKCICISEKLSAHFADHVIKKIVYLLVLVSFRVHCPHSVYEQVLILHLRKGN